MGNLQVSCRKCIRSREVHNPLDDHLRAEARELTLQSASRFKKLYSIACVELSTAGPSSTAEWWVSPPQGPSGDVERSVPEGVVHPEAVDEALFGLAYELRVVPAARLFHNHGEALDCSPTPDPAHVSPTRVVKYSRSMIATEWRCCRRHGVCTGTPSRAGAYPWGTRGSGAPGRARRLLIILCSMKIMYALSF